MADRKISDLTALTAPASGDYLPIVDISEAAAANKNKRITIEELFRGVPLGTAAAPSIAIEGDENTGIYSPGADQLAISTGGSGRLFVDASGIIKANNSLRLANSGSGEAKLLYTGTSNDVFPELAGIYSDADYGVSTATALLIKTTLAGQTTPTERLRITSTGQLSHIGAGSSGTPAVSFNGSAPVNSLVIDSSGRCGIGTSSASVRLQVQDSIAGGSDGTVATLHNFSDTGADTRYVGLNFRIGSDNGTSAIRAYRTNSVNNYETNLSFWTNPSGATQTPLRAMTIDSSQRVGIGVTSPGATLDSAGDVRLSLTNNQSRTLAFHNTSSNITYATINYNDVSGRVTLANSYGIAFNTKSGGGAASNATESACIDSSGRLLVGTSSARANFFNSTFTSQVQIEGTTNNTASAALIRSSNDNGGSVFYLAKQRGAVGANGLVSSGDRIATISFQGSDGTEFVEAAKIEAEVDGTPGTDDMPGRLVFSTTADGASSPTERMRIDNAGTVQVDGRNGSAAINYYSILPSPGTSRDHFFGNTVGVGTWALQGNGTSTWTSDERRKKNIETTRDGYLEDLAQLRVVKYNWNVQSDDEPKELGLIAQEVEQVFPGLVVEAAEPQDGDDYNLKSVKFSVLPFMLLKALQEAAQKIETLEAKVAALESA